MKMGGPGLLLLGALLSGCGGRDAATGVVNCSAPGATRSGDVAVAAAGFGPTWVNKEPAPGREKGMVWIPGGEFSMGAPDPMAAGEAAQMTGDRERMEDARPVHRVRVKGFYMDTTEVTNEQFAAFVRATGYVTVAERKPTRAEFPDAPEENLVAGSMIFTATAVGDLTDPYQWWRYVRGACWRHPSGPGSDWKGKEHFPVVHVSWEDAAAYAKWAGKRLPTEAEWEFAARGGLVGRAYTWGDELRPDGRWMANTWQGRFPERDEGADGFAGMAPVAQFPPNGYGLYDMSGNVWEWCSDWYRGDYYRSLAQQGVADNPAGPPDSNEGGQAGQSVQQGQAGQPMKVQRGGSFLCTDQYCMRYKVGTRGKGEYRSSSNHVGFRCVRDVRH